MEKKNCWEIKKCGREPGGARSRELGVCVAASAMSVDGLNNGSNGGRICWAIAGTLCRGEVTGLFAKNEVSCMACEVFKLVKAEEKADFIIWKSDQTCESQVMLRLLMNNFARHEFQR
ncbi:MAG: hypothetical protein HZC49_05275 [Nitrospirae bacterium]|nr:hypothetical protein [Nitrospirota bacterium]